MRRLASLATLGLCLLALAGSAGAACHPAGADAVDVANAREAIAAACDCDGAPSAAVYKRCAKTTARDALANDGCVRTVVRCAAKSTCGRPGAAVCCRTTAGGVTRGGIVRAAEQCRAPRGGSACVGTSASVCDACGANGCIAPSECGNGLVELGEQCDGQPYCRASCALEGVGCCQGAGVCRDFPTYLSSTLLFFCSPDQPVRGTCGAGGTCDPMIVEPDVMCCANGGTCDEIPFGGAEGYTSAAYTCFGLRREPMIGGSCGVDGRCQPGAPRPPLDAAWGLAGTPGPESCPAPAFESFLSITRTGANTVTATGFVQSGYAGFVHSTGFRLDSQVGSPLQVPCPGGLYEANLRIEGVPQPDGTFAVTQRWGLSPLVMTPGCPSCTKTWTGTMTFQFDP